MEFRKSFFHSVNCLFWSINGVLYLIEAFSFKSFNSLIVDFSACITGVLFRILFPMTMHSRVFPNFFPVVFSASSFMFRALIYLDLSFVQGDSYGSICILLHDDFQLNLHYLAKMQSLFHRMFLYSLSKIRCSQGNNSITKRSPSECPASSV